jgi:valyl-tRNA synthetase
MLQNALAQKMDASGYREKAPQSVQEEDMRKLTALLEQLEVISEAEKKLDSNLVCTEVGPHIFFVCKKLS